MKKILCILLVLCAVFAQAAEPEDIEPAIADGLAYLASQQQDTGEWYYSDGSAYACADIATTALVLLKFEDRAKETGYNPFDEEYMYSTNVQLGMEYLFSYAQDTADGVYVACNPSSYVTYSTGAAMMAVAASDSPDKVITTGPLSGATYAEALQGMMDWMEFAQQTGAHGACEVGGWAYYAPYPTDWADMSNSGYAALGVGFAAAPSPAGFGLSVPDTMLDRLSTYVDNVQDPMDGDAYDGGAWYEPCMPYKWVNVLKTGNLLHMAALVGDDETTPRVQNALGYLQTHWDDTGQQPEFTATSLGWKDSYQAMFTMMKGLEALGIEAIDGIDWFDEVSDVILANQNADGSFDHIDTSITEGEQSTNLRTAWALLTLERVVPEVRRHVYFDIKPTSCPNPLNVGKKGVMPVAILGTEDFDVTTIDPETVMLTFGDASIAPLRWSLEDVATPFDGEECGCHELGPDGYMDLTLKFDAPELVETFGMADYIGNVEPLQIEGSLLEDFGSADFQGQDCVRVQGK